MMILTTPLTRLLRYTLKSCLHQPLIVPLNQGWTLIEIGAITVIVGILAAMSYPSMAGMKARSDLRSSMEQVKSAVAEAQRAAIKKGISCTVDFTKNTVSGVITSTISGTPAGCISLPVTLQKDTNKNTGQEIFVNGGISGGIVFSYKGNTVQSGTLTIDSFNTSEVKCLTIASGLGLFRTGNYTGSPTNPTAANCTKGL